MRTQGTSSVRAPLSSSPSFSFLRVLILNRAAKSKKQRRLALKRQRLQEAKLLESGDLAALVPKIPLQKQTVNLPAAETGNVGQAIEAVGKREELRRAMRKERRAGIKESNYLKGM